jgi:SAM-dependent methyltransferase
MLKIKNKIKFEHSENLMKHEGDVDRSINYFKNNKNVQMLLRERFQWMNTFIKEEDKGIEFGAAAGFSKKFIKSKNFKISDYSNHAHLDYKNIDAQNTGFENNEFDFIISSNMIHHLPFPQKYFNEMHRILKKGGKLIIFDAHCSVLLQLVLIIMKHEGFDFTKNVWSLKEASTDDKNLWSGNSAIPYLIFNDKKTLNEKLGSKFNLTHIQLCECLLFLNSGGVTSKTFYIPLNLFFLRIVKYIDKVLSFLFPTFFSLAYKVVLEKK